MARVAVLHEDGAVSAYKYGRVEDGVTNIDPLTGAPVMPLREFLERLADAARTEFPSATVQIQRMVMHPDETLDESVWIPEEEFDPEQHTLTPPGNQPPGVELNATQSVRS